MNDDLVFIQDNASIHTAHKVKDWFREQVASPWGSYQAALSC
jgi:hypothetical protein